MGEVEIKQPHRLAGTTSVQLQSPSLDKYSQYLKKYDHHASLANGGCLYYEATRKNEQVLVGRSSGG